MDYQYQDKEPLDIYVKEVYTSMRFDASPNWRLSHEARQSGYLMAFCTVGRAYYTVEGERYTLVPGDLLFIRRDAMRCGETDSEDPWGFYIVCFDLHVDICDLKQLQKMMGVTHFNMQSLLPAFREIYHTWVFKRNGYKLRIRNQIESILIKLMSRNSLQQQEDTIHAQIEQIVYQMEQNPQLSFSVVQLAKECNFSEGYFRRRFKLHTGMATGDYLQLLRINLAKSYLLYGSYNVAETAQLVGFSNAFYFSRVFKRITGISPSDFAKGASPDDNHD